MLLHAFVALFYQQERDMNAAVPPGDVQPVEIDDRRRNPERRKWSRRRTIRGARTVWPNGDSSECIVTNLSETGAQLRLRGPSPNVFDLIVDGEKSGRTCFVIWRKGNRVGVKFRLKFELISHASRPLGKFVDFARYPDACRMIAGRTNSSDRELLLEMAEAWTTAIRRMRSDARQAKDRS